MKNHGFNIRQMCILILLLIFILPVSLWSQPIVQNFAISDGKKNVGGFEVVTDFAKSTTTIKSLKNSGFQRFQPQLTIELSGILASVQTFKEIIQGIEVDGSLGHIAGGCESCAKKAISELSQKPFFLPTGEKGMLTEFKAVLLTGTAMRQGGLVLKLTFPDLQRSWFLTVDSSFLPLRLYQPDFSFTATSQDNSELKIEIADPLILDFVNPAGKNIPFTLQISGAELHGEAIFPPNVAIPCSATLIIMDTGPYDRKGRSMLGESLAWFPSLVKKLVASGSAVFIYDRRGTGLSSVVKNLPFHRHVQDAITIYRFMKMIPSVNADSIIILGVGTGSYAAQKIASSTIPPWAVAFLYPPLPNYLAYWETKEGETSDFSKIVANLNAKRSTSVTALTERNGRNIWLASNPAELKDLSNIDFMDSLSAIPCETVIIMSAGESILAKKCEKSGVKVVETTAQQNLSDAVLSWLLEISRPAETK